MPKCPIPVFFVVDIEELLTRIPDKCYYSNGNMQCEWTKAYKVVDDPSHINAEGIYDKYNKNARQQEFLVLDELDLSCLSSLQIYCYNDYQKKLLLRQVSTSPLRNRISLSEKPDLYERVNRELKFNDCGDILEISTDYDNPFEFRIEFSNNDVPDIKNVNSILREKENNIYVSDYVKIRKDKSFRIYFEVSDPRKSSWLIYTN